MKRDNKGNGNLRDVVASCVECRGEVVTDETGIFVRSRDSKALSEEIKEFFSKDYKQIGKNACKMSTEKYNWNIMINQTIKEYNNILGE